jgi:hypothetical protein
MNETKQEINKETLPVKEVKYIFIEIAPDNQEITGFNIFDSERDLLKFLKRYLININVPGVRRLTTLKDIFDHCDWFTWGGNDRRMIFVGKIEDGKFQGLPLEEG